MNMLFNLFVFLSEIALWGGVGRLVYLLIDSQSGWAVAAGVAASLLLIAVWAMIFAPKARWRLPRWPRLLLITGLSAAAGVGLLRRGDLVFGLIILIGTTVLQAVGQYRAPEHLDGRAPDPSR